MFMSKLFSLQTKTEIFICLFSMGLMVCIWIFGYAFLAHEKQITLAAARQANANRAQILEHQTQAVLKEIDDYLLLVKQDYESSGKLSPATLSFTERLLSRVDVKQIGIADRQGNLALFGRPEVKVNIASEERFQSQKKQNSTLLHIDKPHLGLLPDQHYLYLSMRLNDREGDFAGIASVAVSMENFFASRPVPTNSHTTALSYWVWTGLSARPSISRQCCREKPTTKILCSPPSNIIKSANRRATTATGAFIIELFALSRAIRSSSAQKSVNPSH